MAGTRREENLDEGNNNGLEGVVEILERVHTKIKTMSNTKAYTKRKTMSKKTQRQRQESPEKILRTVHQVYTDKDQPGASPSLDVSLR